jgi:cytochrome o ubiquinol oxidase subunit 1
MMYINLIWAWGHPEVYILVLPAFGIYSEVVATFSHKYLFGYVSMVWAIIVITFLSFIVWLHHFFTMGASPHINAFFGIMTMIIAVPTGVKVFNWLFTMFRGKVVFSTPMLWFMGFVVTFSTGGMTGVLMSMAPVDFQVHNSLFLIAHFHSMVIGGVLFSFFAGVAYWFPKIMGYKLDEKLGKIAFWFWIIGFLLAFMPLYLLGLMGATRRLDHYDASLGWQPLFIIAAIGVTSIVIGVGFQILQLFVSIRDRKHHRDTTGDPWNGRTLEWATKSPPPLYNFAVLPEVDCRDPFWVMKKEKISNKPHYKDIHMPKNTPMGLYIGGLSMVVGFALVWYMMWLALIGMLGILACLIVHLSNDDIEYVITADELKKMENKA